MSQETFEFQAEARQLLNLVVNSIYSNKEIFLRELLSNASDAMDKLKLEALQNTELDADVSDLHIEIKRDEANRTLQVIDNGIGMSRDDLQNLIGTIARSGTAEFMQKLQDSKSSGDSAELIGQFGVGFYSVFMVAKKAVIETRRLGETAGTRWESEGDGKYSLEEADNLPQGTTITLYLKDVDEEDGIADYTKEWTVRDLVKRYSDFLSYPVKMTVTEYMPIKEEGSDEEKQVPTQVVQTVNSMKALWARPAAEVEQKEYNEFYKHVSHDWDDPLETIVMKGEGTFEFQSLLFIPKHAPFDLFMPDAKRGVELYVKKVFIMDRCEELVPFYLRFLRGVVDAQDLSLNVSREILQKDRQIKAISKSLVKKVLSTLKEMKKDRPDTYKTFWQEFGKVIKEGIYREMNQQKALLDLVLLPSTNSDELTSLDDYISRMKPDQKDIYYITGENRAVLENSPHLEIFRAKGIEVLLLTDTVDSVWVETVNEFKEKGFKSVVRGSVDLGSDDEKKATEEKLDEQRKSLADMLTWMNSGLTDLVKEVRVSSRLTNSPACLVSDEQDPSPSMEKIMKAMGQAMPPVKRILEINPNHAVIERLHKLYEEKGDCDELKNINSILYSQALIAEGGELADPAKFTAQLTELMTKALQ